MSIPGLIFAMANCGHAGHGSDVSQLDRAKVDGQRTTVANGCKR